MDSEQDVPEAGADHQDSTAQLRPATSWVPEEEPTAEDGAAGEPEGVAPPDPSADSATLGDGTLVDEPEGSFGEVRFLGQPHVERPARGKVDMHRLLAIDVPRRTLAGAIAFFLAGAAVAGTTAVIWEAHQDAPARATVPAVATVAAPQMATPRRASANEATGVVEVVATSKYTGQVSTGAGVVLSASGTVVTAHSLLIGATDVTVLVPGVGPLTATVTGSDLARNISVLTVKADKPLTPAPLADAPATTTAGTQVAAIGTAGGSGQLLAATGPVTANAATLANGFAGLQVQAAVSPGFAGAPIIDSAGHVLAVAIDANSDGATTHVLGLDAPEVLAAVGRVAAGQDGSAVRVGAPAFLGLTFADPDKSAVVHSVLTGTAAAGAGLAAGDQILSFDGTAVTSAHQLATLVANHKPGDAVVVAWSAAQGPASATLTLGVGPVS